MVRTDTKLSINTELVNWYQANARDLPWRRTTDPYAIWVSEIMLQQTRVETVIPYYNNWLSDLPTLGSLALADQDQVLKLWEGLGYYRRALNLHKAAKLVEEDFNGNIPEDAKTLESLPGIGRYTAGAISSIAFDHHAPILDGNIRRVFSRLFNITTPLKSSETENKLWQIAEDLLPDKKPGEFNQALMELGALLCLPTNPNCTSCPLVEQCQANQLGIQESLPVRMVKDPLPHYQVAAAVIEKDQRVLIAKRPPDGLLGGLWEFPGGKQEGAETLPETLRREIQEELDLEIEVGDQLGSYQHAYTHYKVTLHAYQCHLVSEDLQMIYHTDLAWVPPGSLQSYPMGKLDRMIAKQLKTRNDLAPDNQ
jgi:A/G-specific adenine glycosylase